MGGINSFFAREDDRDNHGEEEEDRAKQQERQKLQGEIAAGQKARQAEYEERSRSMQQETKRRRVLQSN